MRKITFLFLISIFIISLVGCGSGGGGGAPAQITEGPGDAGNYFPFTQGNTWVFRGTVSEIGIEPVNFTNIVQIAGTKVVNGVTTTVLTESNPDNSGTPDENYLLKDSNGITYRGNNDITDNVTPQVIPYQEVKFPLQINSSFTQFNMRGLDFGEDIDGDGRNETVDVNSVVTVKGFETITVQVGTFNDSAKIETKLTITTKLSSINLKLTANGVQTQWFAPGVGLVKRTRVITAKGFTQTAAEELIGYSVEGSKKGILPEFQIVSAIAPPDSNTESPGRPAISFDGTNYLVVSRRVVDANNSNMIGTLVSEAGDIVKTFDISSQGFNQSGYNRPAVGFDGTNYLVVLPQDGQIVGQRVTTAGTLLDGISGFAISTGTPFVVTNWQPAVAFDGTNYLVVWQKISGDYNIYGARITPNGQVLDEFPIFTAPGWQINPSITFDGTNYLVVWEDTRSGAGPSIDTNIIGTRVTPQGGILDPGGIGISTTTGYHGTPQVIFDGANYFVAWINIHNLSNFSPQPADVYGTRIKPDGALLDSEDIPIITNGFSAGALNLGYDGENYFVVYTLGSYPQYPPAGIFVKRISTTGVLVGGPSASEGIFISGPSNYSKSVYPVILYNGKNSLLAWVNNSELIGTNKDLMGVLIYPF